MREKRKNICRNTKKVNTQKHFSTDSVNTDTEIAEIIENKRSSQEGRVVLDKKIMKNRGKSSRRRAHSKYIGQYKQHNTI